MRSKIGSHMTVIVGRDLGRLMRFCRWFACGREDESGLLFPLKNEKPSRNGIRRISETKTEK